MWIESHTELGDHPKKDALADLLFNGSYPDDVADYATIGLLHRLWWWAILYTKDGDLASFSDRQIAKGCKWAGDPATLLAALREVGFIDQDGHVNDWHEYAGKLLDRRAANAARMRKARAQHVCATREQHVRNTCGATVPYRTVKPSSSSTGADDGFDEFWTAYPRKVGKVETRKRWPKLNGGDRAAATAAAGHVARYVTATGKELKYIPHPSTFIGPRRLFEDWATGWPDGYGNDGAARKAPQCGCGCDLTYDERGLHCPDCGFRPPSPPAEPDLVDC